MPKKALIAWGGWDGHEPEQVANVFSEILANEGFEVEVVNGLESVVEPGKLDDLSLFVPVITMSEISQPQLNAITHAVAKGGVGIAGCHGGMCDSFRNATEWQFMTGGQWVAHPGDANITYKVNIVPSISHPIVDGIADFDITSEQYYLHVDPGIHVLATTDFPLAGVGGPHVENPCKMPVVWTKKYGQGKVYYNALGHVASVFDVPEAKELMRRGFLWAAK